jgi:hypothetical protein
MDPDESLAGTWKINDTLSMDGWSITSSYMVGPIYFTVTHDQEDTKFKGLNVSKNADTNIISLAYWPLDYMGLIVYEGAEGWNPDNSYTKNYLTYNLLCNQTITIYSTDFYDESSKTSVTNWLNANATKIS